MRCFTYKPTFKLYVANLYLKMKKSNCVILVLLLILWNPERIASNKFYNKRPPMPQKNDMTIEDLYREALREEMTIKEPFVVYAGGDSPNQLDDILLNFKKRFPGINVQIVVDFSKNHNGRIDYQLSTRTLVPSVAHLQTLYDFDKWKKEGQLLKYRPIGWEHVYNGLKDEFYVAIGVIAFTNYVNQNQNFPREAEDYTNPSLRDKIVSTYPNDDDAVLYWYKLVIDKYGWNWLQKFLQNNPKFVRGTQATHDLVRNGTFAATFTTAGSLKENKPGRVILPMNDPFMSWGQRAAIFKQAKRPHTAKLYLSWWLDRTTQTDVWDLWSVRKDVPPPPGYTSIFSYPGQTDPFAFETWMKNRAEVEKFRSKITLFVGEVFGESPTGELGLYPPN